MSDLNEIDDKVLEQPSVLLHSQYVEAKALRSVLCDLFEYLILTTPTKSLQEAKQLATDPIFELIDTGLDREWLSEERLNQLVEQGVEIFRLCEQVLGLTDNTTGSNSTLSIKSVQTFNHEGERS
jgi:hypothetical protein